MLYLCSKKVKLFLFVLVCNCSVEVANAQRGEMNLPNHSEKNVYFGISFSYNRSSFNASLHPLFLARDSVFGADPYYTGGFSMGFVGTARLSNRFELRYNPQLIFAEKSIEYRLKYPITTLDETPVMKKKVESIIFSSPVHIKFNSDRINNFSFYVFSGVKLDLDLASNARKKQAESLVKIDSKDYGIEAGIGFQFYFKSFIFTPEIKVSNGVRNVHFRDAELKFSNVIDELRSRMIVFTIHLQG